MGARDAAPTRGPDECAGKKFWSRGIDDQGGLASALAMIDTVHRSSSKPNVAVLLTRAEEEGFVGAIAAVVKPKLLRRRPIASSRSSARPSSRTRRKATA